MSIRADLEVACDDLAAGQLPDEASRRLVARAARAFLETPSPARDQLLRRDGQRDRDEWLRRLACEHCQNITSRRAKARKVLAWATRYQTTAWRRDAHAVSCPERLVGTPQEYVWRALSAYADIPGERRLFDIIS